MIQPQELCRELQFLAARGTLKAAERRLAQQAQQTQHGTAGAGDGEDLGSRKWWFDSLLASPYHMINET